jgi:hypothetical protein
MTGLAWRYRQPGIIDASPPRSVSRTTEGGASGIRNHDRGMDFGLAQERGPEDAGNTTPVALLP